MTTSMGKTLRLLLTLAASHVYHGALSLSLKPATSRKEFLHSCVQATAVLSTTTSLVQPTYAEAGADTMAESFDVDSFLRTGMVAQPMGVSGQAGKSRPETGVILRDGSEVFRDPRSGSVLAEIIVKGSAGQEQSGDGVPILASYESPWPLATGTVFDVECRDPATGDGVFLAVTKDTKGKDLSQLPDSFFVDDLFAKTGRFSFYGQPTDIKVKQGQMVNQDKYRTLDLSFSTLSQSTQAEIPRRARVIATIPEGTRQAVMLVASASANRWKKGSEREIASVIDSFRAINAPQTSLKVRGKERRS